MPEVPRAASKPRAVAVLSCLALLLALGAWLGVTPLRAQDVPNVIVDIRVEGLDEVDQGEVFSAVGSQVGGPLNRTQVTEDIKALYTLGFFERVQAEVFASPEGDGYVLVFVVEERPRVAELRVTGNTQVRTQELYDAIPLNVGSFFNRATLERSVEEMRRLYREEGYLKVQVTPEVEPLPGGDYRVVLRVREAPRLYITEVRTQGNEVFSELEIRRIMQSAEVDCFDWLNDSGLFDEERINSDLESISAEYLRRGYIRVFIEKPDVTLVHNPEFSSIIVELSIHEGEQYFTGEVDVQGDILGERQELIDQLGLQTGDPYNPLQQNQDVFALTQYYQAQGYAFAQVRPEVDINEETNVADVTYRITRGEKAYIGRIEFEGNRETRDFVLRREFEVRENQLYDGRKLRESQQNLLRLGYFQPSLDVQTEPREVSNVLDVHTSLEEAQTGTLQAQIGYSEHSGVSGSVSLSKGNFLGRGQTVRLSAEFGERNVTRNFSADFIEPHLAGTEFSSDSSVNYRTRDDITELDRGTITETTLSQGVGYPFWPNYKINLALSGTNRDFEEEDVAPVRLRTLTTTLSYDTVNHPIFPTRGTSSSVSTAQIGGQVLGGTTEYRRYRLRYQRFIGLDEQNQFVVMGRARMGWLEQVGNNLIPPEDRFRIGGITTLRGFNFNEVGGPSGRRQRALNSEEVLVLDANGDPVLDADGSPQTTIVDERTRGLSEEELEQLRSGGVFERLFTLELLFPLAGDNVRGVVFYDAGQVNAEPEQYELLDEPEPGFFDLLQSVGTGVRLITPLGVFRFEYGLKLTREEGESPDKFEFTISTLF